MFLAKVDNFSIKADSRGRIGSRKFEMKFVQFWTRLCESAC